VGRLIAAVVPLALAPRDARAVLLMLTSFETFDALAGEDRAIAAVAPVVQRLAEAALRHGDGPVAP